MDGDTALEQRARHIEQKGRCFIGPIIRNLYRIKAYRPILFRILCVFEGGPMFSKTLREILKQQYDVHVGIYSYGSCLRPGVLPAGTSIGNYCSIADFLMVIRRNHPADRLSQHPLFFNHKVGLVLEDTIHSFADNPLEIGHDVWIGANVFIAPGCKQIGNSSIIAAGSVVRNDVPPFAIVGGVPAKLIRWRFPVDIQKQVEESQWWLRNISELVEWGDYFTQPLTYDLALEVKNELRKLIS